MDDRVEEALKVVGFVALLVGWFGAAAALSVLSLDALPDPVAALVLPAWLLLPMLLLGAYYRRRGVGEAGSPAGPQ